MDLKFRNLLAEDAGWLTELANDPEDVLNINLETTSYILIIYNGGNKPGSAEDFDGKGCAINIDGRGLAFSWQSPYGSNKANSLTVAMQPPYPRALILLRGDFSPIIQATPLQLTRGRL